MKKLLLLLFLLLIVAGCNKQLTYKEISLDKADKDIKEFLTAAVKENGAYLFQDGGRGAYIFLNGRSTQNGDSPVSITNFDVKGIGDTVNLYYVEKPMNENGDDAAKDQILYKVTFDKDYEKINLIKNNEESFFHTVSGRQ